MVFTNALVTLIIMLAMFQNAKASGREYSRFIHKDEIAEYIGVPLMGWRTVLYFLEQKAKTKIIEDSPSETPKDTHIDRTSSTSISDENDKVPPMSTKPSEKKWNVGGGDEIVQHVLFNNIKGVVEYFRKFGHLVADLFITVPLKSGTYDCKYVSGWNGVNKQHIQCIPRQHVQITYKIMDGLKKELSNLIYDDDKKKTYIVEGNMKMWTAKQNQLVYQNHLSGEFTTIHHPFLDKVVRVKSTSLVEQFRIKVSWKLDNSIDHVDKQDYFNEQNQYSSVLFEFKNKEFKIPQF